MGSKSSSTSAPINQQLSSGAANNVTGNSGSVSIVNQLNDFGAVQGGLNLGQSAVSMAGTTAEAAMMANSAIANNSMTNATLQSAASLQAMLLSSQSANAAAAAASQASSIAAMSAASAAANSAYGSAKLATDSAYGSSVAASNAAFNAAKLATDSAYGSSVAASNASYNAAKLSIDSGSKLAADVMQRTQDQLSGVLGAVKSNSLAMVSSTEATGELTKDMTQKLLIAAGLVGAVMILR
jgi:hypothetical protein